MEASCRMRHLEGGDEEGRQETVEERRETVDR